jgi:hypothetical protein
VGWSPHDELEHGFVQMHFYSSITVFARDRRDCVWRPRDTAPVESGLVVLPRVLPESQLGWLTQVLEHAVLKSARNSTWLVEREGTADSYCERGLQPMRFLKLQKMRARQAEREEEPAERGAPRRRTG